ncbi:MAG TPA: DUF2510 domain-containing protein [Solirubrobacterales bacterium]|jgi:hypothetical protein|nr:DUF2510 domain-containing protein [Solirubrobacterales bacterium]
MAVQQTTVIQLGSQKSVGGAVALGLFFGPLGMLYSTIPGALIMLFVNIVVAAATLGLGLFLTLPICAIWAGIAANSHNNRLQGVSSHAAVAAQPAASPAGWHDDPQGSGRLRYYDGMRWTDHYAAHAPRHEPVVAEPAAAEPAPQLTPAPAEEESATGEAETEVVAAEPVELAADAEAEAPTAVVSTEVFCGACGHAIAPSARFCSACGETQAVG